MRWALRAGGAGKDFVAGLELDVVYDAAYIVGDYSGPGKAYFGNERKYNLKSFSNADQTTDIFVLSVTLSAGAVRWVVRSGTSGPDRVGGCTLDVENGMLYVTGQFQQPPTYNESGYRVSAGSNYIFVMRQTVKNTSIPGIWPFWSELLYLSPPQDAGQLTAAHNDCTLQTATCCSDWVAKMASGQGMLTSVCNQAQQPGRSTAITPAMLSAFVLPLFWGFCRREQ